MDLSLLRILQTDQNVHKSEVEKDLILLRIMVRRHHDLPHSRLPCHWNDQQRTKIYSCLVTGGRAGEVADEVVEENLQHPDDRPGWWSIRQRWWPTIWRKPMWNDSSVNGSGKRDWPCWGRRRTSGRWPPSTPYAPSFIISFLSFHLESAVLAIHLMILNDTLPPWSNLESLCSAQAEVSAPPGRLAAHWLSTCREW